MAISDETGMDRINDRLCAYTNEIIVLTIRVCAIELYMRTKQVGGREYY